MQILLSRRAILATSSMLLSPGMALAQDDYAEVLQSLQSFIFGTATDVARALPHLRERGKPDVSSSLILALRFTRYPEEEILDLLEHVTGATPGRTWGDWMLWQEASPDVKSHPAFYEFKRTVLMMIDENWRPFLEPDFIADGAMDIRFEEVAWGWRAARWHSVAGLSQADRRG